MQSTRRAALVLRKRLRRSQVLAFFAGLPPCLIGVEACATAHHWARELIALGHETRLMPPSQSLREAQQHDVADAEAICEAVRRPSMRFVPLKAAEQQSALMMHGARDLLIRQRTMLVMLCVGTGRVRSCRGAGRAQSGETNCDCHGRDRRARTGYCPSGAEGDRQPDRRYPREATPAAWIRFTLRLPSREAEKRLYSRQFGSHLGTDS